MKNNMLFLGVGKDQLPAIKYALELGLKVFGIDGNPEAAGKEYCDEFWCEDIKDSDKVEAVAKIINKKHGIDGIMAPAVEVGPSVGRIVDKLQLRGIGEETALKLTDKILRRQELDKAGILQPKWAYREEKNAHLWNTYPCVVKPRDGAGARGIRLCYKRDEMGLNYDYIEEYIEGGWELSVEALIFEDKIAICVADRNYDKKHKYLPYLLEDGCSLPSKIPDRIRRKVDTLVDKVVRHFKLNNCAIKFDLLVKDNQIYTIEIAPRLGGGKLSSVMIPMAFGVDWWKLAIKVAMGMNIDGSELEIKHIRPTVQRYKFPEHPESHTDRLFSVECEGETYEEALKKCEAKLES